MEQIGPVLIAHKLPDRIMRKPVAGGGDVWLWTVTGPYLSPNLQPSAGDAASLEEAKEAFKLKFMVWLHWAVAQGGEVHWRGGAEKAVP